MMQSPLRNEMFSIDFTETKTVDPKPKFILIFVKPEWFF